jgi:predicted AlkP superfamily phosphohydrolase/phosphomutase
MEKRVIVIGFDGLSFDLVKSYVNEGKLPFFQILLKNGVSGKLRSTIPPISPSAWTSIFTGVNPGKHGIFSFVKHRRRSYFFTPVSSKDRKVMPIWNFISARGKKVVVLNVPITYPPDKVRGIMMSGLGTPSKNSKFVYPPQFKKFLERYPKIDVDFNEELLISYPDKILNKIFEVTNERVKLVKELLRNTDWQLFIVVFRALDVLQHFFFDQRRLILKCLKTFDKLLGYILTNMQDNTTLIVCSDHGFCPLHTKIYVNNWLESLGLFKFKKEKVKFLPIIDDWFTAEKIRTILLKLGLKDLVWKIKNSRLSQALLKFVSSESLPLVHNINWSKTKAYFSVCSYAVYINLKGKKPEGIVKGKKEYDAIRNFIIQEAQKLVDPRTGNRVIKKAYLKEELFSGESDDAPDVILLKKEGYRLVGGYNRFKEIFVKSVDEVGDHHEDGILIIYGPDIKNGIEIRNVTVYDIAPTILHILQFSIPNEIDGRVLREAFKKN